MESYRAHGFQVDRVEDRQSNVVAMVSREASTSGITVTIGYPTGEGWKIDCPMKDGTSGPEVRGQRTLNDAVKEAMTWLALQESDDAVQQLQQDLWKADIAREIDAHFSGAAEWYNRGEEHPR